MLSTYQRALGQPGALRFSMAGLIARIPIPMLGLGMVVLISGETGSYSLAGAVSAVLVIAEALCAILQARLLDSLGQTKILRPALAISMTALVLLMVAVGQGWHQAWYFVFAALCGGTFPVVGGAVRTRWAYITQDRELLQTAYAFEAVVDEVVWMIGPPLVTLLAVLQPYAGLTTAVVAAFIGVLLFTAQRDTEPPPHADHILDNKPPIGWSRLIPIGLVGMFLGVAFGVGEVTTAAFADEHGHKALAGILLACWALGSLIAGVLYGTINWRVGNPVRLRWSLFALGAMMLPLPFISSPVLLGVCLFIAGWGISPGMIAATSWIEEIVPSVRLTEGITVLVTALAAGFAIGAAIAGLVIDKHGANTAYWAAVAASLLGSALAYLTPAGRPGNRVDNS